MRRKVLPFIMLSFLLGAVGYLDSEMVQVLIHGLGG